MLPSRCKTLPHQPLPYIADLRRFAQTRTETQSAKGLSFLIRSFGPVCMISIMTGAALRLPLPPLLLLLLPVLLMMHLYRFTRARVMLRMTHTEIQWLLEPWMCGGCLRAGSSSIPPGGQQLRMCCMLSRRKRISEVTCLYVQMLVCSSLLVRKQELTMQLWGYSSLRTVANRLMQPDNRGPGESPEEHIAVLRVPSTSGILLSVPAPTTSIPSLVSASIRAILPGMLYHIFSPVQVGTADLICDSCHSAWSPCLLRSAYQSKQCNVQQHEEISRWEARK